MNNTLVKAEQGYTYGTLYDIVILDCPSCGIHYGIMTDFRDRRVNDHRSWYCPNGHSIHFPQDNEAETLRKEVRRLERSKQWSEDQRRAAEADAARQRRVAAAARGRVTKIKNRIANGVCPAPGCKRSGLGADVMAHIASCHPDFHGHQS